MNKAYIKQLRRHGRPKRIRQYIATLLFWGVTIALVVLTSQNSRWFNAQARPVPFYSTIAVLVIAPMLHFEFYRFVTERTYRGVIVDTTEKNVLKHNGEKTWRVRGDAMMKYLVPTVGYEIKVKDTLGLPHRYTFKGEREVAYAKEYYHAGDAVTHVLDCKYPLLDKPMERNEELCVFCGCLDKQILEHTHCPKCGMVKRSAMPKND